MRTDARATKSTRNQESKRWLGADSDAGQFDLNDDAFGLISISNYYTHVCYTRNTSLRIN